MKVKEYLLILCLLTSLLCTQKTFSIENKILFKINNKIITSLDVYNEQKYLSIFNENFKNLPNKQSEEIAANSLIKEKIKEIELNNYIKNESKESEANLDNIIEGLYQNIGIENINDFKNFLIKNQLSYNFIREKIEIEKNWNELIYVKYSDQIKINDQELKEKIKSKKNNIKSYLLSEIFFSVQNTNEYNNKLIQIENDIKNIGFENSAIKHSLAQTSAMGGKIGWINENSLNKNVLDLIQDLNKGEHTKPISIPGGTLIIKINDVKKAEVEIDFENEFLEAKKKFSNQQLNQFSKIHFDKVKKNIIINEL